MCQSFALLDSVVFGDAINRDSNSSGAADIAVWIGLLGAFCLGCGITVSYNNGLFQGYPVFMGGHKYALDVLDPHHLSGKHHPSAIYNPVQM